MEVYRGYTADALDLEYNNRRKVPDYQKYYDVWEAGSQSFRESARRAHLDVSFGPGEFENLDLFLPDAPEAPLHIYIHGGYWQWMYKESFSFLGKSFVEAGTAFAVLNYALCPSVTMEELIQQIRAACAFLYNEAAGFGYSSDKMHVSGHSAGGHLTAMVLATDWSTIGPGLPQDLIKSGISISGVFDIEPLLFTDIGDALRLDADGAKKVSPLNIPPVSKAPFVISVGGDEGDEFLRQSQIMADAWAPHHIPIEMMVLPGKNHFSILDTLADPGGDLFKKAMDLLES
jgi:arylformamidase